jgi:hypothetical protein
LLVAVVVAVQLHLVVVVVADIVAMLSGKTQVVGLPLKTR